MKSE
jgi:uncharacterized coiled-coil protein SlyX